MDLKRWGWASQLFSAPEGYDSTWEEKELEDSRRRRRRDDSAGKEVGIEDKSQVEKEMSPCSDERQSIGDNLPWSPLTTRGNHGRAHSFPGPHTGKLTETHHWNSPKLTETHHTRPRLIETHTTTY
ncbi:hypothetical protein PoB_004388700 [Plakobranchus ocellatus]|uniref:Uncharacterized protein n=1 Tax=Plakobranchus ocellatus TaxID=259542 RepID=A0AAV4BDX1_9GAST|nr:hypothetical protein PoB_004388700 [Plakobranchus ocellatus]